MSDFVEAHGQLVKQRVAIRQDISREERVLSSVRDRLDALAAGAERTKAADKLRHTESRLADLHLELIEIEGQIEHLKFEADFT